MKNVTINKNFIFVHKEADDNQWVYCREYIITGPRIKLGIAVVLLRFKSQSIMKKLKRQATVD